MLNSQPQLDLVFQALSNSTRRAIVERLGRGPASVSQLAQPFGMTLPAVVQHLHVLEASGLVRSEKVGRVRTCRIDGQTSGPPRAGSPSGGRPGSDASIDSATSARARELVEEALRIAVAYGDRFAQGQCHTYLGMIAQSTGDDRSATSHYRSAIACLRPYRDASLLPMALVGQAGVLARRDLATALRVAAAASAVRARVGGEFQPRVRARLDVVRNNAEAALGAEAARIWKDGIHLTVDDGIALAFGAIRPRTTSADGLSVREREVAALVAHGLTNKEIAGRLHLSVRTVESHVRHMLTKLGLVNRTQLASWMRQRSE